MPEIVILEMLLVASVAAFPPMVIPLTCLLTPDFPATQTTITLSGFSGPILNAVAVNEDADEVKFPLPRFANVFALPTDISL